MVRSNPVDFGGGGGSTDGTTDSDAGTDPTDPRDAPSARGNDTGGDAGASVEVGPDPADPSPTSRAGTDVDIPDGASDGGSIGERITSNLETLGQAYTENVAEPVGDFTAATNPIARAEQATIGTNAIGEVSEGVGEGVAQIGNVPGNTAAGIDAAQALAQASARSRDQVTIGGVPTGITVPNPEGQRQNAQAAGNVATSAAASAASSPFETTGQIIGGALGGAAVSRGVRGASRAADAETAGTGASTSSSSGSLLDDIDVPGSETFDDFVSDTRAQRQIGSQRDRGTDTGTTTITADDLRDQLSAQDRARAADLPDRESDIDPADAIQRRRDERIRGDREVTDRMERDSAFQQFRDRMDNRDPDPILREGVDSADTGAGASAAGGSGTGTGLGSLAGVNDPTGIADTGAAGGTARDPAQILGAGTSSTGAETLSETNDPTGVDPGVLDQLGGGRLGGGTLPGDASGSGSGTATGTDTFAPTDSGSGTDLGPVGATETPTADLLATTTVTGTQQQLGGGVTDADLPGASTVSEPVTDAGGVTQFRGFGGGGGGGSPPRPREEEEPEDDAPEAPLSALFTDSDRFGSGIASAEELLQ